MRAFVLIPGHSLPSGEDVAVTLSGASSPPEGGVYEAYKAKPL